VLVTQDTVALLFSLRLLAFKRAVRFRCRPDTICDSAHKKDRSCQSADMTYSIKRKGRTFWVVRHLNDGTYVVIQGFSSDDDALRRIALLQQRQSDATVRVKPRAQSRPTPR
jgi:hypothetical protein